MYTRYEIGDRGVLTGRVSSIEQTPNGRILYTLREYDVPIPEEQILGRLERPWDLVKGVGLDYGTGRKGPDGDREGDRGAPEGG